MLTNLVSKNECAGCGACYNTCSKNAITMQRDEEGFIYPIIDDAKCVKCCLCQKVCPVINYPKKYSDTRAYACYGKLESDRIESSSGGIFYLLARKMIEAGGIVYGAAFSADMSVKHIRAIDAESLQLLRGSKYVQSEISNTYIDVKKDLNAERKVLFSGTPCQVAGLKSYLQKDYDNLLCVDVICHGVPSPDVWKKYLDELSPEDSVVMMKFREKCNGMNNALLKFQLKSGKEITEKYKESTFMKGFTQNLFLRPSCYQCINKGIKRCSDITLGDFWGIKNVLPEFNDEYGVSAVIVHNPKGQKNFDGIASLMSVKEVSYKSILQENESLIASAKTNHFRHTFFYCLDKQPVRKLIEEYYDPNFWDAQIPLTTRLKIRIKSLAKK